MRTRKGGMGLGKGTAGSLPDELEEDPQRDVDRAAGLHEVDRVVEVDVVPGGERGGALGRVTGALQALGTPALDLLELGVLNRRWGRRCRHVMSSHILFGQTHDLDYTMLGNSAN
jgi:hypothetical protein